MSSSRRDDAVGIVGGARRRIRPKSAAPRGIVPAMDIRTEDVRLPGHGGEEIGAHLARPAGAGPWPALVVVHEVFGLTAHVRAVAGRFAAEGFVALAPDLWWRDRGKGFPGEEADLPRLKAF